MHPFGYNAKTRRPEFYVTTFCHSKKTILFFFLVLMSYDHGKNIRNSTHIGLETSFPATLRPSLSLLSLISISVIAFATSLGCSET